MRRAFESSTLILVGASYKCILHFMMIPLHVIKKHKFYLEVEQKVKILFLFVAQSRIYKRSQGMVGNELRVDEPFIGHGA